MILEELLPMAEECGITYQEFMHMTPLAIRLQIEGFWKRRKNDWEKAEYQSWLTGYFTMNAVGTNISKKVKYPDNPLNKQEMIVDISDMDEEEITKVHEDFLEKLDLMARTAFGG